MEPIYGMISGGIHSPARVTDVKDASQVQKQEEEHEEYPGKPVRDEYISEEKQDPTGRYWLGKDENDNPKIYFDDLKGTADEAEHKAQHGENRESGDPVKKISEEKAETCTVNTDKVDREIEKLKKKQAELKRQLNSETDERKIGDLEQELARVENELRQKDNDTYRRQHAQYSYS
ncbi:MAG: hypothetical protein HFJ10_06875 [Lachnospiraceae bacterium]|jgi:hypothetical protein|nr:hypothetical protein [Lachnospiraceae bacterium]